MKIAIVGYDLEGKSSYNFFAAQGHEMCIRDQNHGVDVPEGVPAMLGDDYLNCLDEFDLIVRTAGINPSKILAKNPDVADKITTHIQEFMRASPTKNIIGVTGTKGKGTTSTLICKILEAAGKTVKVGGNIGIPPLGFINELNEDSWVVLELSSFQLIDLRVSPHIAVCLMVVPEHLDWHADTDEYFKAKAQLFAHQATGDIAVYFPNSRFSKQVALNGQGQKVPYFATPGAYVNEGSITIDGHTICKTTELKLLGAHNWQNVCAAITAAWQAGIRDTDAIRQVVTTFTGLPFRLELVRELDGVKYYNDSFGTAPETAMVAIQAFSQPEVVILGGRTKGIPFSGLAEFIAKTPNVKTVITIGETGPEIAAELRQQGYQDIVEGGTNMDDIVTQARGLADPGDVVLLSTACTSFDMFKNYKDRGEQFSQAVKELA
jgi:UDP-N-acetylmuramoylalanine--D-glutamate ligase